VLADQQAEAISEAGLAISGSAISIVSIGWARSLSLRLDALGPRSPAELLHGAEADTVGFAESAIDGTSLGDTQFGAMDERGDIRRIRIPITNKPSRHGGFVDDSFEHPSVCSGFAQSGLNACADSKAVSTQRYTKQAAMRYVPPATQKLDITSSYQQSILFAHDFKGGDSEFTQLSPYDPSETDIGFMCCRSVLHRSRPRARRELLHTMHGIVCI